MKKVAVKKTHNFSAGPAILPTEVIKETAQGVLNLNGTGLSVLEMSHRGKDIGAIADEATQSIKDLVGLSDEYEVLWMSGGASSQFFITAMNLLDDGDKALYIYEEYCRKSLILKMLRHQYCQIDALLQWL